MGIIGPNKQQWVVDNLERRRAQQSKWYQANAARIAEKNKLNGKARVEANNRYYDKFPNKLHARHLKHAYGLSWDGYYEMLTAQNGVCAICLGPESDNTRGRFCVDHDHATGKIRGLLCGRCNRMLGQAKDSVELLTAGVRYLLKAGGGNSQH